MILFKRFVTLSLILFIALLANAGTPEKPIKTSRDLMLAVAKDAGEYFRPKVYKDYLEEFSEDDYYKVVPQVVIDMVSEYVSNRTANLNRSRKDAAASNDKAFLAPEGHYKIKNKSGKVIGFVVNIWDEIDHPLWDGSGIRLYLTPKGRIIIEVPWEG